MPTAKEPIQPQPVEPLPALASAAQLEEPQAGGRYLRDPLTGALTPNTEPFTQPE